MEARRKVENERTREADRGRDLLGTVGLICLVFNPPAKIQEDEEENEEEEQEQEQNVLEDPSWSPPLPPPTEPLELAASTGVAVASDAPVARYE